DRLNKDSSVDGIMLMKPMPKNIDYNRLALKLDPAKDIEGIHPFNIGRITESYPYLVPPTVKAVLKILDSVVKDLKGLEVVIVGHSYIVGKPLALLLADRLATVTICHIGTSESGNLKNHVKRADILVVAAGKPNLIKGSWIKEGAVVVDVGINKYKSKIVGDVEFEEAKDKASFITPVPGGVGPLTNVMLMENLLFAAKRRQSIA
ncbi:MAG TPA: bifunctional 5,10-methylenetetrahydrofolate dehydrogenase/5,10-methenyltetrahydrofolate cyclohydrolase, partial [Candidatus Omnitrophica bacterium]|nr:bifunctional 5,10-methylenetetrahydrofolate dehydrogenase/5,10-methenyltetrahydrofolate cyclohydrolase [Candidatus Omnitrophota bacterium]